jgi:hypothetical protein
MLNHFRQVIVAGVNRINPANGIVGNVISKNKKTLRLTVRDGSSNGMAVHSATGTVTTGH